MARTNVFSTTANAVKGSYWVIWLFVAVVGILIAGMYFFFEDSYSSYIGIQQVQMAVDVLVVSFPFGLYVLAVTPQLGQVVFGYLAVANRQHVWYYRGAVVFFLSIDVAFDVWYRSNQRLFSDPVAALVSILVTLVVYTLFSEMFIMLGGGLAMELLPDFKTQLGRFFQEMQKGKRSKTTYQSSRKKNTRNSRTNRSQTPRQNYSYPSHTTAPQQGSYTSPASSRLQQELNKR